VAVDIRLEMSVGLGLMKPRCVQKILFLKVLKINTALPFNDYFQYFGPDYRLEVPANNMENMNSKEYLQKMTSKILENLKNLDFAPSVQMHQVPHEMYSSEDEEDTNENKEERITQKMSDRRRVPENELSDSEDEGVTQGNRRNQRSYGERRSLLSHDKEGNAPAFTGDADDEADL
jgi:histone deacetylase 1/2